VTAVAGVLSCYTVLTAQKVHTEGVPLMLKLQPLFYAVLGCFVRRLLEELTYSTLP
jgi:hypothetical protein